MTTHDVQATLAAIRAGKLDAAALAQLAAAIRQAEGALWTTKTEAARRLGVTLEVVRGRCRRATAPVRTLFEAGRELVDLHQLAADLKRGNRKQPQPTRSAPLAVADGDAVA